MVEKLLRCVQCNQVIPLYGDLIDIGENIPLPGVTWAEDDLQLQEEFFLKHRGHSLEELTVDFETYMSDKPALELIKVSYFEATNGREKFLIKRIRERLDQPAHYEIMPGKLKIATVAQAILEEKFRKELTSLNALEKLTEEDIASLIKALREELNNIVPEELFRELEKVAELNTPLPLLGTFKREHWHNIIQRLQNYLPPFKFTRLLDFLEKNGFLREMPPLFIQREMPFLHYS